ncbi:putative cytochrome P450 [Helianthus annuus]|uniref:Cytochrome P450 n=2 Tax=Helianthus annuus TaxID=4232 RepID=A0A251SNF1_HELAN|nr:putative cytochrome P450 [Helianthus annuus]KAJ0475659.1 putative cytochrome P450 [Helianthus annuus]KAJ0479607.1 putative cytochrome P450 [Helianthus annuus]KAJ0496443.1 putative cytochrome P450 [Helianthus annuus]KAJ0662499.1 putative cytochrome P450 [Helianthus annuus]
MPMHKGSHTKHLNRIHIMEFNLLASLFLFATSLFLLFVARKYPKSVNKNIPPGPRPWPIIGNMHQMVKNPHIVAANLAKKYGPLISLRLGTRLLVVASSPEAAKEILKTQDRRLSGRSIPDAFQQTFIDYYFVWARDCNEHWKSCRTLCRAELFLAKAIEAQTNLRNEKLAHMLDFLNNTQGKVVKIEELVFTTLINTLSNILFSKDFLDLKDDETAHRLKSGLLKILENTITPNVSDFFPILGGLDLQGLRKDSLYHLEELASFSDAIVEERRARIAKNVVVADHEKDFLDRLLENNFTTSQINILVTELFIAGVDTVVTTIEWAMAELLKNQNIMHKVKDELKREVNYSTIMTSDLSKLTYFNACIKETLRLHPVVPVLIPRRAIEACVVMNYTIPQNAQVWVNVWAISHDPTVWEDPNTFKPERFLGSNIDFAGRDYEFIPFGGGRRMCPGLPSAVKSLQSILGSLILGYDWTLPNDEDPAKLDMTEKFGVTLQKENPLQLIFNRTE